MGAPRLALAAPRLRARRAHSRPQLPSAAARWARVARRCGGPRPPKLLRVRHGSSSVPPPRCAR
eukprot:85124-Alexandrium_andersonii.AAC.1